MPNSFYAGVTICGVYSEGLVIPQYYENGEWWYWMPGVGTVPEHHLVKKSGFHSHFFGFLKKMYYLCIRKQTQRDYECFRPYQERPSE